MTINRKNLEKRIDNLKKRGKGYQEEIQNCLKDAVTFAKENEDDVTLVNRLYNVLPAAVRKATFKAYIVDNFPFRFIVSTKKSGAKISRFKFDDTKKDDAQRYVNMGVLNDTPFYNWQPAKGDDEAEPLSSEELEKRLVTYLKGFKTKQKDNPSAKDTLKKVDNVISMFEAA